MVSLEHPEALENLHRDFQHAGSDIVQAFTYNGHREKMKVIGKEKLLEPLNRAALKIAKKVASDPLGKEPNLMAGNISNSNIWDTKDPKTYLEVEKMFSEMIGWAVDEGADMLIGETFYYAEEAFTALKVMKQTGLPSVITIAPMGENIMRDGVSIVDTCKELDVLPSSKEDLIKNSDFLSIHVQGGERYKDCITLKEMDKMKKTAFLINTSRGPIINEDDLIIALSTNEIAGAGLDVYEREPLPENNKLRFLPNALLTPHIGYVTAENYSIYYNQMIEALESCVNGKPIRVIE